MPSLYPSTATVLYTSTVRLDKRPSPVCSTKGWEGSIPCVNSSQVNRMTQIGTTNNLGEELRGKERLRRANKVGRSIESSSSNQMHIHLSYNSDTTQAQATRLGIQYKVRHLILYTPASQLTFQLEHNLNLIRGYLLQNPQKADTSLLHVGSWNQHQERYFCTQKWYLDPSIWDPETR